MFNDIFQDKFMIFNPPCRELFFLTILKNKVIELKWCDEWSGRNPEYSYISLFSTNYFNVGDVYEIVVPKVSEKHSGLVHCYISNIPEFDINNKRVNVEVYQLSTITIKIVSREVFESELNKVYAYKTNHSINKYPGIVRKLA